MSFRFWIIKRHNKELSEYEWGPIDKHLKSLKDDDFKNYRTISPKDFHKIKRGTCWDYVEAQREWYIGHKISHKVYYLELNNKEKASHSIIVAEVGKRFIWDEASWKKHVGVHSYDSRKDLLNDVCKKHSGGSGKVVVYEYSAPSFGKSVDEFMSWVKGEGKFVMVY